MISTGAILEDLDGLNKEVQPVLLDNMRFLSDTDRRPNSFTSNNVESLFLVLMYMFIFTDLSLKIRKRKREGNKYWQLILLLIFFGMLFILWILFEVL